MNNLRIFCERCKALPIADFRDALSRIACIHATFTVPFFLGRGFSDLTSAVLYKDFVWFYYPLALLLWR